ncbi:MAG: hypothetical protein KDC92_15240, partial [Bacteroidetes bacterium]|nr:hypothetical protein [Bacteroidota bacterium]
SSNKHLLQVDLVYLHHLAGNEEEKDKEANKILDDLPSNTVQIQAIAGAFERREFPAYAFATYQQGRKVLGDKYAFSKAIAEQYAAQGDMQKMIDEYVVFLIQSPSSTDVVKSAIANEIDDVTRYNTIKTALIKSIQEYSQYPQLVDVLSWTYVSKREFYAAFIQLKSLDVRLSEAGRRLIELAEVCRTNIEFKTAEKCYDYVLGLGSSMPYYYQAKLGLIDTKYQRLTLGKIPENDELVELEGDFKSFVQERAIPAHERWEAYIRLAELQAVYLGKYSEAIQGLEEIENSPRIDQNTRGRIKIDIGNYYLLSGDIWEASLKYSQVEKLFKDHPLGHEAKFMNAKLSFYRGDFEWAAAQLKVLKGSTSELIANDALQLSILIQDNLALDTIKTPLELYANAEKFIFMKRFDDALLVLDTILEFFPGHSLSDEILLAKGRIQFRKGNYDDALKHLNEVFTTYAFDILADDALYLAANILQYQQGKEQEAKELLGMIIFNYKDSIYGVDARERYRTLQLKYPDKEGDSDTP